MPHRRLLDIYANRRMATLLGLGFASGLPLALTGETLQVWMRTIGVDLGVIGLFALVGVPYSAKVFWAPFMDRYVPRLGLGRRRAWLLITQVGLILAIASVALVGPQAAEEPLRALAIAALIVALLSASQDIVADAYRADVLRRDELGVGAGVFVTGYQIAMIASAGGALILAEHLPWRTVYLIMAATMGVGVLATLLAPEPPESHARPATIQEAIIQPLARFLDRPSGWLILVFVVVFKLPDIMARTITGPFLVDRGFTTEEIGYLKQILGLLVTIGGALIGGGIVVKIGLMRSLIIFGVLQAVSNAGFLLLATAAPTRTLMGTVIGVESFCTGLVTAGFIGFLMSCCDRRYSATQFALLTSLMQIGKVVGGAPTGFLAKDVGYPTFFFITILAGIPGLLMLPWLGRFEPAPDAAPADLHAQNSESLRP